MTAPIHVPDLPGPMSRLCWQQSPLLVRCDRKAGHQGPHSWECVTPPAVDGPKLEAALAFVAEFHGDPRCSLNCMHAEALAAAVRSMQAELAALKGQNTRLHEAIEREGEDADFYFIADPEHRLFVNLNDTFGYAVADAEPIPWDEFDAVMAAWRADPVSLIVWAARKRGYDLMTLVNDAAVPPSTRDALMAWQKREGA